MSFSCKKKLNDEDHKATYIVRLEKLITVLLIFRVHACLSVITRFETGHMMSSRPMMSPYLYSPCYSIVFCTLTPFKYL